MRLLQYSYVRPDFYLKPFWYSRKLETKKEQEYWHAKWYFVLCFLWWEFIFIGGNFNQKEN